MRNSLPVVSPLERALFLRSLPLFRDMPASELVVFAELMRETWVRRGTMLLSPERRVREIFMLVEGTVRHECDGRPLRQVAAPAAIGLVEILADQECADYAVADSNMLVLAIDREAFLDILEDHFSIVLRIRAALGQEIIAALQHSRRWATWQPPEHVDVVAPPPPLDIAERLITLERSPVLTGLGVGVLAALTYDDLEIRLEPGTALWEKDSAADFFAMIVHGIVTCSTAGSTPSVRAGPSATIGAEAVVGGIPHIYSATAETAVVAIPIRLQDLLDVAEDHSIVAARLLACSARFLRHLEADSERQTKVIERQPNRQSE